MAIKVTGSTVIDDNKIFLPNNSAEVSTSVSIVSNAITLDLNTAGVFTVALTANINTITLSNVQSSGRASSFVLEFTGDGTARTVIWPANFLWPNDTAPDLTDSAGKKDVFVFYTTDGGVFWQAFISGQNL